VEWLQRLFFGWAVGPDQRSAGRTKRGSDLFEIRVGFAVEYERESVRAELASRPAVDVGQCERQVPKGVVPVNSAREAYSLAA
jgi:hypothetical protein